MFDKLRARVPGHGTVVAYIALFLTLTGGTAFALAGANTVFTDDIKDGEVRSPDIRNGTVGADDLAPDSVGGGRIIDETVGSSDIGPQAVRRSELAPAEGWRGAALTNCGQGLGQWQNYDGGVTFSTAAFYRDPYGTVHIKGVVTATGQCGGAPIFRLPLGYRCCPTTCSPE
jgi:hypothetical protein